MWLDEALARFSILIYFRQTMLAELNLPVASAMRMKINLSPLQFSVWLCEQWPVSEWNQCVLFLQKKGGKPVISPDNIATMAFGTCQTYQNHISVQPESRLTIRYISPQLSGVCENGAHPHQAAALNPSVGVVKRRSRDQDEKISWPLERLLIFSIF